MPSSREPDAALETRAAPVGHPPGPGDIVMAQKPKLEGKAARLAAEATGRPGKF